MFEAALRGRVIRSGRTVLCRNACGGPLELVDLDLRELQYGRHDGLRLLRVGVLEQPRQRSWDALPGEAEAVLEPAARALFAAVRERRPVVVDLLLGRAADLVRDRLVEGEVGTAVERDERLAVELEVDRHHSAGVARPGLAVMRDAGDPRVREQRRVEAGGLLALRVEPEACRELRHLRLLSHFGRSIRNLDLPL